MDDVTIRYMRADEFECMRAVAVDAFGPDEGPSVGVLIDALRASWAWADDLSFVADLDGTIVGQVLYTRAMLDTPTEIVDVLVLSPIGVATELQQQGIGGQLIIESLRDLAAARSEPLVFLEGHPSYYQRFGFRPGSSLGVDQPSRRTPDEAFMAFPLPPYEPWMTGRLVYPDAFWRTDSVGLRPTTIDIDGGTFTDLDGFYMAFSSAVGLDKWGRNLDAFNDVLRGGVALVELPGSVIRWHNAGESRRRLGSVFETIVEIIRESESGITLELRDDR